jgi:hypothetical protein
MYKVNNKIDRNEYFEDMVGVTRPDNTKPENIVLQFHGSRGKYIETKPMHGSQTPKWIDENINEVKLNLIINKKLISILLSYGADLIVVKTDALKEIIANQLINASKLYER